MEFFQGRDILESIINRLCNSYVIHDVYLSERFSNLSLFPAVKKHKIQNEKQHNTVNFQPEDPQKIQGEVFAEY